MNKLTIMCVSALFIFASLLSINGQPADNSGLVIIDVQKAFSEEDGFSPVCRDQADSMLPVINELVKKFGDNQKAIL